MTNKKEMPIAGIKWLCGRMSQRAKDARQSAIYVRQLSPVGYPYAEHLAKVHTKVAEYYESEVKRVLAEDKEENG